MNNEFNSYNTEAEQSFLGGLLLIGDVNNDLFSTAMQKVKLGAFYSRSHKIIFAAIKELTKRSENVDLIMLEDYLTKSGDLDTCGGYVYLAQCMQNTPSKANILSYAKIITEFSIERYTLKKLNESKELLNDSSNGTIYQRIGMLETILSEIGNRALTNKESGLKHVSEYLGDWLDNIDNYLESGEDANSFDTGIESLDEVLGFKKIKKGSLVGVGARPKMGKSAFMMLLANYFSLNKNKSVAVFSMEMNGVEIVERGMSERTNTDPKLFYSHNMRNDVSARREMAFDEYLNSKLHIDDGTELTLAHIKRESRKLRKDNDSIGLICVDYLTLMKAEKADRNDLAYGEITKGLKNLAKELDCVVLLLLQLNRGLESRQDKRPVPSDGRDTGQIEQDVDLWIGLYKESVYNENVQHKGLTEVIVRLNRNGNTGTAFVDMRQGYHVPLSLEEGARMLHDNMPAKETKKHFKYNN